MKKAIILGGSSGMGKAIADGLSSIGCDIAATSKEDVDTSDLTAVKKFAQAHEKTDILVLNTGGPPQKEFFDVTEDEWQHFHKQLFLGFCVLLQNLKINDNGYIFLISSHVIKEPNPRLVISNVYRIAFSSVFKTLSRHYASRGISCINIAPGPIKTERLYSLVDNMEEFEKKLPMGRAGDPKEMGDFVKSIVAADIHYLNGVVINFDGGLSSHIF